MSTIANGYGIQLQYHPAYPPHAYPPHTYELPIQYHPFYLPHGYDPPHAFSPRDYSHGYGYGYGHNQQQQMIDATRLQQNDVSINAAGALDAFPPMSGKRPRPGTVGGLSHPSGPRPCSGTVGDSSRPSGPRPTVVPNKKKTTAIPIPRSNLLRLRRGARNKLLGIPFPQQEGRNFDAARTDCLSLAVLEKKAWKDLVEHCRVHVNLDCPILPATLSKSLPKVLVIFCLHCPGDNHIDEMTEDGLLWVTRNGYLGEICLRLLTSTINRTIHHTKDLQGDCRDNIAFTDINMCPAPNKCGGDHNHPKLQALTENVPIETIRLCHNAKIVFFGEKPNQYAVNGFLQRLENEGLADEFPEEFRQGSNSFFSNCRYLTHSQFFLMQQNTIDHTKDLFRFVVFVIHAIHRKKKQFLKVFKIPGNTL